MEGLGCYALVKSVHLNMRNKFSLSLDNDENKVGLREIAVLSLCVLVDFKTGSCTNAIRLDTELVHILIWDGVDEFSSDFGHCGIDFSTFRYEHFTRFYQSSR